MTELNETEVPNNLSKIKINVENFIYKACESLLECHSIKNKINALIKQEKETQILELRDYLKEELLLLEKELTTQTIQLGSNLNISVIGMDNFPKGDYGIKLITNIHNKDSTTTSLPDIMKVSQKNESIIFKNIIEKTHRSFERIRFSKGDQNNEKYLDRYNSGSSLSTITIECKKLSDNITYTGTLYFHDFLLTSIESILNAGKKFIKTINLPLNYETEKTNLLLEVEINFDSYTLHGIFSRILLLYETVLNTKNTSQQMIDQILEHFDDISETIKNYLNNAVLEDKRDACCACYLF
jgi:hypothetical protein